MWFCACGESQHDAALVAIEVTFASPNIAFQPTSAHKGIDPTVLAGPPCLQEVQYQPARNSIYEADWLAADAYDRADPEAIGNATPEEFRWAMSVRAWRSLHRPL